MLKIRRPLGRLIFNMGIAIPGKTVFLIETAPWAQCVNPVRFESLRKHKYVFVLYIIHPHWIEIGIYIFSNESQRVAYLTYIVNSMAADDQVTQGARALAAMVSTWFACNYPDPIR